MEHDAGDGVHHGRESGERQNVTRDFDGALFGGALNFLDALGMRHGADVPDVAQDFAGVGYQQRGKLAVIFPSTRDGLFVDGARGGVEKKRLRWDVRLRTIEAHITLALLLGIVERMRVKERPDELAGDILQAEFEMGVLKNGVMAAVEGSGANVESLLVCDFFGADEARGVAGASRGYSGVE